MTKTCNAHRRLHQSFNLFLLIGEELSLYVILLDNVSMHEPGENLTAKIWRLVKEKLARIPDTKLVICHDKLENLWAKSAIPRETLEVYFRGDSLLPTVLEHLEKRWQTLDLISVMQEVKRTLANLLAYRRLPARVGATVRENLSCIPRLQKVDKSLGKVVSKQE